MTTQEIQYRAAYRRARIHRNYYGFDYYGPGLLAATLRGESSRRGYIAGLCAQDEDTIDIAWAIADNGDVRA